MSSVSEHPNTAPKCPLSLRVRVPLLLMSQRMHVLSNEAVSARLRSGDRAHPVTVPERMSPERVNDSPVGGVPEDTRPVVGGRGERERERDREGHFLSISLDQPRAASWRLFYGVRVPVGGQSVGVTSVGRKSRARQQLSSYLAVALGSFLI